MSLSRNLGATTRHLCLHVVFALAPVFAAQAQTHEYALTHSLEDLHGGSALVSHGGSIAADGYRFQHNQGLSLNVNLGASWSVVLRSSFNDNRNYNKILDLDGGRIDDGYYSHHGAARWFDIARNATPVYVDRQFAVTVLTRSADGMLRAYVNGVQQFSVFDAAGIGVQSAIDPLRFFMDDNRTQAEASDGVVSYIGLYDDALSAEQIAAIDGTPTVPIAVSEPGNLWSLTGAMLGLMFMGARRRRQAPMRQAPMRQAPMRSL
jgi:hypothetical protein